MSQQPMSFADASRSAVEESVRTDRAVIVLRGGEVAGWPPGSVLEVPVADRAAAGLAYGLALGGRKVVLELADTSRLPAIIEVLAEAGAASASGEFSPTLILRVPYGAEAVDLDLPVGRWLTDLPGVRVVCPSTADAASGLLRAALAHGGVTIVLESRSLADARGSVSGSAAPFGAQLVRTGEHVTLVAWGAAVETALAGADALAAEGIEADVVDLVSLAPLDARLVGERARATGRVVVVHPDDPALARRVREIAVEGGFLYLEAPLTDAPAERDPIVAAARRVVSY